MAASLSRSPSTSSSTATATVKDKSPSPSSTMVSQQSHTAARPDRSYTTKSSSTSWNPLVFVERKLFGLYWHIETVFALAMLEAWEVFLVITVFLTLTSLILYSLIFYFPRHIQLVARRAMYYVYGTLPSSSAATASMASLDASAPKAAAAASQAAGLLSAIPTHSSSIVDSIRQSTIAAASKLDL